VLRQFVRCEHFHLTISNQTSYLKTYMTNLCQIFRVGRTVAVYDQSEISFFPIPRGTLPRQPHCVGINARVSLDAGG